MNLNEFLNQPLYGDSLQHAYASEYYDPVKAHEYYMQHRQLKGRQKGSSADSGSDSGSSGSSAATGGTATKSAGSSSKSSYEQEYERYNFQTQKKIRSLQQRLGRMSKEARMLMSDEIYAEIDKIREENMNKKYELKAKYGKGSGSSSGGSGGKSALSEITSANYKKKWGSG